MNPAGLAQFRIERSPGRLERHRGFSVPAATRTCVTMGTGVRPQCLSEAGRVYGVCTKPELMRRRWRCGFMPSLNRRELAGKEARWPAGQIGLFGLLEL